jgi:hypothetical protein
MNESEWKRSCRPTLVPANFNTVNTDVVMVIKLGNLSFDAASSKLRLTVGWLQ